MTCRYFAIVTLFENGTPVKFQGTRIANNKPCMPDEEAVNWIKPRKK